MDVELKPCPFCGAPAHMYSHAHHPGQKDGWCVMCNNTECKADCYVDRNSQEDAIAAWNHRHSGGDGEDAARYRWLRAEHAVNSPLAHVCWKRGGDRDCSDWVNTISPEWLDASIDTAIEEGDTGAVRAGERG